MTIMTCDVRGWRDTWRGAWHVTLASHPRHGWEWVGVQCCYHISRISRPPATSAQFLNPPRHLLSHAVNVKIENVNFIFYVQSMTYAASFIFNCQALLTLLLPCYNNTAQSVMRWTQSPTLAERKPLIERLWVSAKPDKIAVTLSRHRVCIEILLS